MQFPSLGWEEPLEKEMATYSSMLAWRIPMVRGAWQATVHEVAESDTTEVTERACTHMYQFSSVQSLSHVQLFATP